MRDCYSNGFFVVDGVLIRYSGNAEKLEIPKMLNGIIIHTIGENCFSNLYPIKEIMFPESVRSLHNNAICNCPNLKRIIFCGKIEEINRINIIGLETIAFPNLTLSQSEYKRLMMDSIEAGNHSYICRNAGVLEIFNNVFSGFDCLNFPKGICDLNRNIDKLFFYNDEKNDNSIPPYNSQFSVIDFNGQKTAENDAIAFNEILKKENAFKITDDVCEMQNDKLVKSEAELNIEKVGMIIFGNAVEKNGGDKYVIDAVIRREYYFYQAKTDFVCNGKKYSIYHRNYLSPTNKYLRRDIAIFKKNELVWNKKEALEAYAKYRFISIL